MADNRFKNHPTDERFTAPGTDKRFDVPGQDVRYKTPGQDNRFEGGFYTGASFALAWSGLSSDSLGDYAQIGNEASISYTITPDNGTDTVAWDDNNPNSGSDYGTGANPTSIAALTGSTLYAHVTDGGETYTLSTDVRYAPGAFGALVDQSFTKGSGDQTYVFPAATGTGLTWTYSLLGAPAGVTIDSGTRTITFDTATLTVQDDTSISVRAVDQYGRHASGSPRSFLLDITEAAAAPVITLTLADEAADNFTFGTDTPSSGNIHWATQNTGDAVPTADGSGGWTGTILESGTIAAPADGATIDIATTATTGDGARRMVVYQRVGSTDSNVASATYTADNTAPSISSQSPLDNATGVAVGDNIVLTFDADVQLQDTPGDILIRKNDGGFATQYTIAADDAQVSIAGAVVTINPTADLDAGFEYAVQIGGDCFEDLAGNAFAGVLDDTTISFTTAGGAGVLDDFEGRTEALDASANWTKLTTAGVDADINVASGEATFEAPSAYGQAWYEHNDARANNQWVESEITSPGAASNQYKITYLTLRSGPTGCYYLRLYYDTDATPVYGLQIGHKEHGSTGTTAIGSTVDITSDITTSGFPVTLRFEAGATGGTLKAYLDGVEKISETDPGTYTSGKAGMGGAARGSSHDGQSWGYFDAGDL